MNRLPFFTVAVAVLSPLAVHADPIAGIMGFIAGLRPARPGNGKS